MRNQLAPCGTIAGYFRHAKRNQEICADCARARAEYSIEYNFNRKLKRDKLAEYARREREHQLHRAMLAMEVLASGRKTA